MVSWLLRRTIERSSTKRVGTAVRLVFRARLLGPIALHMES